jgi:xylulokinase
MSTAGSLTRWFRDVLGQPEVAGEAAGGPNAYAALAELAASAPPGANGLLMLPYFAGERTPLHDPDARGVIAGLTLGTTRADLYRALLEAVGYGIRHNIDAMRAEGITAQRILAVGGGTQNPLWMQMVSSSAGVEQHIPRQQIGAAYGDAMLAAVGVGVFPSTAAAAKWVESERVVRPDETMRAVYEQYYPHYRALYEATASTVHALSDLQRAGHGA